MGKVGGANFILMIALVFLIYFMLIRPQKKRDKEIKAMRSGLKIGDEVVTIGGVVGKITAIKDDIVTVQVGAGKVKIDFLKTAIGSVSKSGAANKTERSVENKKEDEPEAPISKRSEKKVTPKKLGAKKSSENK